MTYDDLSDRVAQIQQTYATQRCQKKYIKYTKRMPITITFRSAPEEERLYDLVNEYLQRGELYAFAASQRHLSTLIIRKRSIIDIRGSKYARKILPIA